MFIATPLCMTKTQRTDPHRPSALVPADYEQWVDYDCGGQWPQLPIGVDCTRPVPTYDEQGRSTGVYVGTHGTADRCCVRRATDVARTEGRAVFGNLGTCGVCGAHFRYGTLFRHTSGALVHMGHDCASKYEMMYDMSATELERGRLDRALATAVRRQQNENERTAFLAKHPGLEADLAVDHRIIRDIAAKFATYRSLSDKQVAFVRKLAEEVRNPKPEAEQEKKVTAPTGKGCEFIGTIVSAKLRTGDWGTAWKITVKVTTPDGVWLAWGTAPSILMDYAVKVVEHESPRGDRQECMRAVLVGMTVDCRATLERPRQRDASECETDSARAQVEQRNTETHFVMMSRPTIVPVRWSQPERSAKRIKAEAAFAKAVYEKRSAMIKADYSLGYGKLKDEQVIEALAAEGVTLDAMIAAAEAPKARRSK